MNQRLFGTMCLFTAICCLSCDRSGGGGSPFGNGPPPSPLLQPFEGAWRVDLEKTIALWKERGVPSETITQARTAAAITGALHEDMKIKRNVAVLAGSPQGEYYFFAVHSHGQQVCAKAWHHEDRTDPGDMSKCYVRLELKGADLHFTQRLEEDAANPNDPDAATQPPTMPANACTADADPEPAWTPWTTYVFVKVP